MRLFFTLLLTLSIAPLSAQLYNGNFENWITFEGNLLLEGWEIFAYNDVASVTQDFDAYEGMYAVQVEAIPIQLGEYGNASTVFAIDNIPPSLDFYVKAATENGSVAVEVIFYNDDETVETFSWNNAGEEIAEWTFVSLPLEQTEPVINTARVNIRAEVGDFAPGSAVISVDQMAFGKVSGLNDQSQHVVKLYPNPATDVVRIGEATEVDQIEVRDVAGKLAGRFSHAAIQNGISIGHLPPASYMVIAHMKSGEIARERLVISR